MLVGRTSAFDDTGLAVSTKLFSHTAPPDVRGRWVLHQSWLSYDPSVQMPPYTLDEAVGWLIGFVSQPFVWTPRLEAGVPQTCTRRSVAPGRLYFRLVAHLADVHP